MKTSETLSRSLESSFEPLLESYLNSQNREAEPVRLDSDRYLRRSILPHIQELSRRFNQREIDRYWSQSSNSKNRRLAYLLYYMPSNAFRVAAVFEELGRLGYQFPHRTLRAVDFGSGPATASTGASFACSSGTFSLPKGSWTLLDQDPEILRIGKTWLQHLSRSQKQLWRVQTEKQTIDPEQGPLVNAISRRWNLWTSSYFLNEMTCPEEDLVKPLVDAWENHLENNSLIVMVEPALKLTSRRLLRLRALLIEQLDPKRYQILLPCLGSQRCGAFAKGGDWCHEEVQWWRPPVVKRLDQMAKLDHRSLPFSYLVIAKSRDPLGTILPRADDPHLGRLVSPSHQVKNSADQECFLCTAQGKLRCQYSTKELGKLGRGDIVKGMVLKGAASSSRIQKGSIIS